MDDWQATFLGLKQLDRRRPALKLGLALQIGFLRMCGRLLDAVRIVPPELWRQLARTRDRQRLLVFGRRWL
jgi:hypothetical protein